jgi:hypothetical protein
MNAESILHEHGTVAVIVHKDQLGRAEKDVVRAAVSDPDSGILQVGNHFVLFIAEEPDDEVDALALAAYEELQEDEQVVVPNTQDDEPTMADLRALTVAALRELASKEEVDLSGLTLKDDILGRLAAHFGLDPAE